MLPIAAENLPSAIYTPLVVLIVGYGLFSILSGRALGHEDRAAAERNATIAFGLVLVAAVYVVVLLITALIQYPNRMGDMLIILVVIGVFFAVLLFVLLLLTEVLPRTLRRGRER
jgi:hypothetical protein